MLIFSGTLFHTKCFLFFSSNFAVKVGCVFKNSAKARQNVCHFVKEKMAKTFGIRFTPQLLVANF